MKNVTKMVHLRYRNALGNSQSQKTFSLVFYSVLLLIQLPPRKSDQNVLWRWQNKIWVHIFLGSWVERGAGLKSRIWLVNHVLQIILTTISLTLFRSCRGSQLFSFSTSTHRQSYYQCLGLGHICILPS